MTMITAQPTSSRRSRASRQWRSRDVLLCIAETRCSADMSGSLSNCCRQIFFSSSSFIVSLLFHQSGKFFLCAMQYDANITGADAGDFGHLFVREIFQEKCDERLFEREDLSYEQMAEVTGISASNVGV